MATDIERLRQIEERMQRERNADKTALTQLQAVWLLGESYADRRFLLDSLSTLRAEREEGWDEGYIAHHKVHCTTVEAELEHPDDARYEAMRDNERMEETQ